MASKNFTGIRADGLKELQKELERRFSRKRLNEIIDKALIKAGKIILEAIKGNIRTFRDTGAEYAEAKLSEPYWDKGIRSIRVYWEGPHHRYSVVHLNEKGFHARNGKFIKPKGYGAIDKAIRSAEKIFYQTVQEEMEKLL
ncbi:hypothetical protein E2558_01980 [Staphylococcus pragensis]|uniref:Bacteriophage protein n=1 Tax=Staphylococcus pragensis TaxID=1611836 RepID=A0A4Z1B447_9STAP|nr:hypothetical protein [Staphylococcus pragensis]RTX90849.1 hypothetical protein CD154_04605 [Staphylococcus carnosus]TGN28423.1 hypothetical protein E2558_01980 [Staphylococcus pragensis]GGG87721.1 hypothetical protein GCM10007342_07250 [Staphylococcus pragensis]